MTPVRLRHIAALLLDEARVRLETAKRARTNPKYDSFKPEDRERAANDLEREAAVCKQMARELQEFSFTWKG